MLLVHQGTGGTVEKLPFPKIINKSIQKNEGHLILVAYCAHQCIPFLPH
jgi:hypothetical protein